MRGSSSSSGSEDQESMVSNNSSSGDDQPEMETPTKEWFNDGEADFGGSPAPTAMSTPPTNSKSPETWSHPTWTKV